MTVDSGSADRWESEQDTRAFLASLPEPPDEVLAVLDAEPLIPADEIEVPDDEEEWDL